MSKASPSGKTIPVFNRVTRVTGAAAATKTLEREDGTRLVEVTGSWTGTQTVALPVAPNDGQEVNVRNLGAAAADEVDVDPGALTIDGGGTVTLAGAAYAGVWIKYTRATDEWFTTV